MSSKEKKKNKRWNIEAIQSHCEGIVQTSKRWSMISLKQTICKTFLSVFVKYQFIVNVACFSVIKSSKPSSVKGAILMVEVLSSSDKYYITQDSLSLSLLISYPIVIKDDDDDERRISRRRRRKWQEARKKNFLAINILIRATATISAPREIYGFQFYVYKKLNSI